MKKNWIEVVVIAAYTICKVFGYAFALLVAGIQLWAVYKNYSSSPKFLEIFAQEITPWVVRGAILVAIGQIIESLYKCYSDIYKVVKG